jgi:hypothetical protein
MNISGAFSLYDLDRDGFITRPEMLKIVEAIYCMVVGILFCFFIQMNCFLIPYSKNSSSVKNCYRCSSYFGLVTGSYQYTIMANESHFLCYSGKFGELTTG